ncbi:PREDICTED: prolyl 4-hydroxylase subunit alpha-2-like [Drosophila arizonae]|uniref:procollagen-proline 4-dioxygenase n=1 Tax=Drosophila arizonae TaxID=7263 RepID=A0ABM1Q472_DROAR|nr:PREDICTED: prolyl 4-hydroxylase subunit alpha-2-like [Drosophila arizonae]
MKSTDWKLFYIAIILLTNGTAASQNNVFTSLEEMVRLVQLEADFIENLNSYADELAAKLKKLKRVIPQMQARSNEALHQVENYISNPINAFSLLRRMHEDWQEWNVFMETSVGQSQVNFFNKARQELPTTADLYEACSSMYRLQKAYNLTVKDMSRGILNGKQYNASLNALDTYAMGKYLIKVDRGVAGEWFTETSEWLKQHTLQTPIGDEREKVLHLFAQAILDYKYYSIALQLDRTLLSKRSKIEELSRGEVKEKPKAKSEPTDYEIGCRGQYVQQSGLMCTYKSKSSAFLRLAPIKMEVLVLDPLVVIFHDVLSSREIDGLQEIARPHLQRSLVVKYRVSVQGKHRISAGTWVERKYNNLTWRIERRIADMVDLNLEGSEPFYVINYGIGGQYKAHCDFFEDHTVEDNRLATILFYMNDVEQGGATVFPRLGQAVRAKRGNALFWYNMQHNGTVDSRTLHGGCPILVGSKWIFTQWISDLPNMFHRLCRKQEPNAA